MDPSEPVLGVDLKREASRRRRGDRQLGGLIAQLREEHVQQGKRVNSGLRRMRREIGGIRFWVRLAVVLQGLSFIGSPLLDTPIAKTLLSELVKRLASGWL